MMEVLKRHLALIAAVLFLTIFIGIYSYTYSLADQATFYIKDIYGSRAELKGMTMSGVLQDRYHKLIFEVKDGQPKVHTEYNQRDKDIALPLRSHNNGGFGKKIDGIDYSYNVEPGIRVTGEISYVDYKTYESYGLRFSTDIINPGGDTVTLTNTTGYGLTKLGDKLYFTVPTTREYTGTNGIYEVLRFSDMMDRLIKESQGDAENEDAMRMVAAFSLDGNKGDGPVIEVLGLEGVGNKLALILSIDGRLVIRSYDPESGAMLEEASLDDFRFVQGRPGTEGYAKAYYTNYYAFSNDNTLNLCFRSNASTQDMDEFAMLSFDLSNGVILKSRTEEHYTEEIPERFYDMIAKGDKVYTAVLLTERPRQSPTPYYMIRPKRLMLYLYDAGKLAYKGEVMTDMNDDVAIDKYHTDYDIYDYRNFENIELR